ncbi:MAG: ribbon-helix-helix domain-containing protein [Lachnospiraceae bacterium]|nr:ribbon-helix-helix domain-containing protein [Lachnospiraceae bacterium]MDO5551774.1 ribbon-helix-helix domain-containing protein [Lachnospiraceae bacterium]
MATNLKRFTISVTPKMEEALDAVKKERYYNTSHNEMIRDLIRMGLNVLKTEHGEDRYKQERTA